jgi:hypothetical protein
MLLVMLMLVCLCMLQALPGFSTWQLYTCAYGFQKLISLQPQRIVPSQAFLEALASAIEVCGATL